MHKVLIADDSEDLRLLMKLILTKHCFSVTLAGNKEELYYELYLNAPDLILMDVLLGGSNGRDLCHELKINVDFCDIPVILISANPYHLKNFNACRANDVIEKPFDISFFVKKIQEHLSN